MDYRCLVVCLWSVVRICILRCYGVDDVDGVDDVIDDLFVNFFFFFVVERNILRVVGILINIGRVVRIFWVYFYFFLRVL